jgi:Tfp pilus assembly protein PilF
MKRYFAWGLLVCALCASWFVRFADAQSVVGNTIKGKIRSVSGQPVVNAQIELQTGNGAMVTQTVTNNEGDYAFYGLVGGSFVLIINDPDHQPVSERVELTRTAANRPGETVRVDITLAPKSKPKASPAGVVFNQDAPAEALAAYRRGVKLIAERKSAEGVAALSEAIKLFPNYFDAHFALALEQFRLGHYDDAIKELELARAINPKDGRLYHTFGLVLFEQKKYAIAAAVFEAAAQMNPTNAEAHLMRGAALIETNQLREAEDELKRASRISSNKLAMVHLHLARVYERRGDRSRAADELEQYLKMSPGDKKAVDIRAAIKTLRGPTNP